MHGVEISPSKEKVIAGGVPKSVVCLARCLNGVGVNTILVTNDRQYRETGKKTTDFILPGTDVHLFLIDSKYGSVKYAVMYLIKSIRKIQQINRGENIDVIHGHSGHIELAIVTAMASRLTKLPAIHTVYCPVEKNDRMVPIYKYCSRGLEKIIAISNNVKRSLIEIGISDKKIEVIPPLIDFSKFKPGGGRDLRNKLHIGEDEFVLLYLGNLTKTKGLELILEALRIIKNRHPSVKLLSGLELSCSGNKVRESEIFKRIGSYGLSPNVIELGLIPNVEEAMATADIVVAPFENTYDVADYPLTILEAMAMGVPIVTSNVGGIPEVIEDKETGVLINNNDPSVLAQEILKLLDDPEKRRKIGKNAAISIRKKLPQEEIIELTKSLYKGIQNG